MTRKNHKRGFNLSSSSSNAVGQPCKGFSLIEAAIVLAVVGGVIGTIWVSAANMYESQKRTATLDIVILAVKKMQNILKNVPDGTYPHLYSFDNVAVGMGALPSNLTTPYGRIYIQSYGYDGENDFRIGLHSVSKGACYRIIKYFSENAKTTNLSYIGITDADTGSGSSIILGTGTFPISEEVLQDKCGQCGGLITLAFNWN